MVGQWPRTKPQGLETPRETTLRGANKATPAAVIWPHGQRWKGQGAGGGGSLHQPRTVCLPHAMTYSLFWFLPGTTSNLMEVSPIPWFL